MSRWHYLLFSGIVVLPLGCLTLPENDAMAYKTSSQPEDKESLFGPEADLSTKRYVAAAQALEKDGHEKEAILEYELARQQNPHLIGISWRLAVLHDRQGNLERARVEYQAALREQPHNVDLLNDVGVFHYQRQQPREAERYLRQALTADPEHKRAWVNLGKVLAQQTRYEESCEAFGHVVRPAQAAANVGILLAKEGKVAEARQVLHKALKLEPDLKPARIVLAQLEGAKPEVYLTAE
jgi:Tfp pilus assembly protein PilF